MFPTCAVNVTVMLVVLSTNLSNHSMADVLTDLMCSIMTPFTLSCPGHQDLMDGLIQATVYERNFYCF